MIELAIELAPDHTDPHRDERAAMKRTGVSSPLFGRVLKAFTQQHGDRMASHEWLNRMVESLTALEAEYEAFDKAPKIKRQKVV